MDHPSFTFQNRKTKMKGNKERREKKTEKKREQSEFWVDRFSLKSSYEVSPR
jgi:hypothetical protein